MIRKIQSILRHAEDASEIAGAIKCTLALEAYIVSPNLNPLENVLIDIKNN
jgi:hypothetical protein